MNWFRDRDGLSRRGVLASLGTSVTGGLAGCLGTDSAYDCDTEPPDPVEELPRPVLGEEDAPVTVAVFEDFGSPACAEWRLEQFPDIRDAYIDEGIVRFEHWDFPIPADRWSDEVANAARGIQDRHDAETFFTWTQHVYEQQATLDLDVIGAITEDVGGNPCLAIADADHEPYRDVLMADRAAGVDIGADPTPYALVDDEPVHYDSLSEFGERITAAVEATPHA